MVLIFLPILAMLALGFTVPGKSKPSGKYFFLILGIGLFLWLGARALMPTTWIYPEGEAITHVRGQVAHLLQVKDWQKKPVIILEGSSATAFGIDEKLLEKHLAAGGVPATVLQFSLSGANHFERLFMLQVFLEELGKRHQEALKKAPAILLSEVFDAYDENPLYLFSKESYSQRTIAWTHPSNIMAAWKAWRQSPSKNDLVAWTLFEHLLLNRFVVGLFSTMEPLNYRKKVSGFFPLNGVKKTFHYHEAQESFEKAMQAPVATTMTLLSPGWVSYYQELQQQLEGSIYAMGFYALPTLEPQRRAYQTAFAAVRPSSTTMIGPSSSDFMKQYLREEFWFDGVHPQGKGAILMTKWLAEEIIKKWPELLATPWGEKSNE